MSSIHRQPDPHCKNTTKTKHCNSCGDICKVYYVTCEKVRGVPGPTGPPGNGILGPTGPAGISYTGPTGMSYTGPSGPSGMSYTGPTGMSYTGPSGPLGPTGMSYTGPTGMSYTGPTGMSYTGPTGMSYTGPTGMSYTGPTGMSYTGPTGMSYTGPSGPTGMSYTGPSGPTGMSYTGPTGMSYTGPTGMIGPTGPGGGGSSNVWLIQNTQNSATTSTENIYRTGSILVTTSGSLQDAANAKLEVRDGPTLLSNIGTITVNTGNNLITATSGANIDSTLCAAVATEQSIILNCTDSAIVASDSGDILDSNTSCLVGTLDCGIEEISSACCVAGSASSVIAQSENSAVIGSKSGFVNQSSRSCVVAGATDCVIRSGENILLSGSRTRAIGRNNSWQLGSGINLPIAVGDGVGVVAWIETAGNPRSIGNVTANAFISPFADYGEMFEWEDGNPNNEDRRGYFVTFSSSNPNKIILAKENDEILGVVTKTSAILGDAAELSWNNSVLLDKFRQPIQKYDRLADLQNFVRLMKFNSSDKTLAEILLIFKTLNIDILGISADALITKLEKLVIEEDTIAKLSEEQLLNLIKLDKTAWLLFTHPSRQKHYSLQVNPEYDAAKDYIPRRLRPEWTAVGLLGKLVVLEEIPGSCIPGTKITVSNTGRAVPKESGYHVLERVSSDTILILLK